MKMLEVKIRIYTYNIKIRYAYLLDNDIVLQNMEMREKISLEKYFTPNTIR